MSLIEIEKKNIMMDVSSLEELMIVEILLNIVMSNAFLDFFFKFFEYLKWISKIQNEIFHFFFLNS